MARCCCLPSCVCLYETHLRVLTSSRPTGPTAAARPSPASVQATPCCRPRWQGPVRRTGARRGLCCQKFPGSCRRINHVSVLLKTSSHHGVRHDPRVLDARRAVRIGRGPSPSHRPQCSPASTSVSPPPRCSELVWIAPKQAHAATHGTAGCDRSALLVCR
jgi:hypothetical protein